MRVITLVGTALSGVIVAGLQVWMSVPAPETSDELGESVQVSTLSPLRLPDCEPCGGLAEDEAACDVVYRAAVTAKKDELMLAHWPHAGRVEWPAHVMPSEDPEAVTERIDAFVDRCSRPGAPLSVRCEEYPCAFSYRRADVVGGNCEEPWSSIDYTRNASVNTDATNEFRFALDPAVSEDMLLKVSTRSHNRGGVLARDLIAGEVRHMPLK